MHPTYYVVLRIKAQNDFEAFGRFNLGHDKGYAERVFEQMNASKEVDESMPIQLDFVELIDSVPTTLHIIACTLEQLALNIKIMTRESFKQLNLHDH